MQPRRCIGSLVALAFALVALAVPAAADTLTVPGDHATIQDAIDAAADLDVIEVSPGTYVETIDFLGKDIVVRSTDGALVTIIDGDGGGSTVTFSGGEPGTAVLEGFTVTGGTGSLAPFPVNQIAGGGVSIIDASPTLRCLTVRGNDAVSGGGIFVHGLFGSSFPTFENCVVEGNTAVTGAGLRVSNASFDMDGCAIRGNTATGFGGGFDILPENSGFPGSAANTTITDTVIEGNTAQAGGGGSSTTSSFSGNVALTDCRVLDNVAIGPGGGLYLSGDESEVSLAAAHSLTRVDVIGNEASRGGGINFDGTSSVFATVLEMDECLIAKNHAGAVGWGGGIWSHLGFGRLLIEDSTFADNTATVAGAALYAQGSPGVSSVRRTIFWNHAVSYLAGGAVSGFTFANNVLEGSGGPGSNIDADPLYWEAAVDDYHLQSGSPATGWGARPVKTEPWTDFGEALPGVAGFPSLTGSGPLDNGTLASLSLTDAAPNAGAILFIGLSEVLVPLEGGTLVPSPDILLVFVTDGAGTTGASGTIPLALGPLDFYLQFWVIDECATRGFSASNGLRGTTSG